MDTINGRTLAEVRRYDLFKLLVALALFINWLFFCSGGQEPPMPTGAGAPTVQPASAAAEVRPVQLRLAWVGDRLRLGGEVADETARAALVDAAANANGGRDRVIDALRLAPGASVAPWIGRLDELVRGARPPLEGLELQVAGRHVTLVGRVDSDAEKARRGDAAASFFGRDHRIENRIEVVVPGPTPAELAALKAAAEKAAAEKAAAEKAAAEKAAAEKAAAEKAAAEKAAAEKAAAEKAAAEKAAAEKAAAEKAAAEKAAAEKAAAEKAAAEKAAAEKAAREAQARTAALSALVPPPVSIFFADNVWGTDAADAEKLRPFVRYLQSYPERRVVLSGFHSRSGSVEANRRLAKRRAESVRDTMVSLGLPADRIELSAPAQTLGGERDRTARRVDVSIR
ncbi:MAG: OmpA family protein [Burkholderiaceae bacterium]|nr:OmpA family protein [Burkholderiaceae bacterium]